MAIDVYFLLHMVVVWCNGHYDASIQKLINLVKHTDASDNFSLWLK